MSSANILLVIAGIFIGLAIGQLWTWGDWAKWLNHAEDGWFREAVRSDILMRWIRRNSWKI